MKEPPYEINKSEEIPGLVYIPNFLSAEEHDKLVDLINSNPFCHIIGRRQQFYGETYYHTTHNDPRLQPKSKENDTVHKLSMDPMDWLVKKIQDLPELNLFNPDEDELPTQCLVNEYVDKFGISSHFDDPLAFGSTIASVSLGEPIYFTMKKPKIRTNACLDIEKEIKVFLEPRSLLILQGDSRYKWRHGITKARLIRDPITQELVRRRDDTYRRLSITIRKLLDGRKRSTVFAEPDEKTDDNDNCVVEDTLDEKKENL